MIEHIQWVVACLEIEGGIPKMTELTGFELFKEAVNSINMGTFKGVPLLVKNSLWSHNGMLVSTTIYRKFEG